MHNRLWKGQVYKCECGWDRCGVIGGCHLSLSLCSSGFQDLLRVKPPSLLMLSGSISISMASLMRRFKQPVFEERILVSCNVTMWSWLKLCSANANLSGWASQHTFLYSIILFGNRAVYEIRWKSKLQPDRPQITKLFIRFACWMFKATDTLSAYVIINVSSWQQCLTNAP